MNRSTAFGWVLSICALALVNGSPAHGQDEKPVPRDPIAVLIGQLDAKKAEARDSAQSALLKLGEKARGHLLAAVDSKEVGVRRRASALLLRLDSLAAAAAGTDLTWAGLRGGPSRSGVVGASLPRAHPTLAWSVSVRTQMVIEGSVIPSKDRVICLDKVGVVRSFFTSNGKRDWLHTLEGKAQITASAALAADRLVLPTSKGLVTLDAKTGRALWSVPSAYGSYAAPAIHGRRVYASLRNIGLRALDLDSGKPVFDRKMTPMGALLVKGELLVTGTLDGRLVRIDQATGKDVWSVDLGGAPQMGPTLVNDDVIVVFVNNRELRGIRASDGKSLWMKRLQARSESESLASAAGRVAVTGSDGYIRVIDGETGRLNWRRDSGMVELGGPCMSDELVVYGANGMITCRDARTGIYQWRMFAPSRTNSTPAAWNGRLFILFGNELRAYDAPKGPETPR